MFSVVFPGPKWLSVIELTPAIILWLAPVLYLYGGNFQRASSDATVATCAVSHPPGLSMLCYRFSPAWHSSWKHCQYPILLIQEAPWLWASLNRKTVRLWFLLRFAGSSRMNFLLPYPTLSTCQKASSFQRCSMPLGYLACHICLTELENLGAAG